MIVIVEVLAVVIVGFTGVLPNAGPPPCHGERLRVDRHASISSRQHLTGRGKAKTP